MDYQQPPKQPYNNQPSNQPLQNQPNSNNTNKKTSVLAILSLIFSILGIFTFIFGIFSILGIIFAIVALKKIQKNPNLGGKVLAIAGLIIGIIVALIFILILILGIVFVGVRDNFTETAQILAEISNGLASEYEENLTLICCLDCIEKAEVEGITNKQILCKDLDIGDICINFFTDFYSYDIGSCTKFIAENG